MDSLNWANCLIWVLGLASLIALTVNDFLPLLSEYRTNNVATQISVIKNDSRKPSNITLCLPYFIGSLKEVIQWPQRLRRNATDAACDECAGLLEHSWDVWNVTNFVDVPKEKMKLLENTVASAIFRKILRRNRFSEDLLLNRTNFDWNQPLVDSAWKFFVCLNKMDMRFLTGTINVKVDCNGFDTSFGGLENQLVDQLHHFVLDSLQIYLKTETKSESEQSIKADFFNRSIIVHFEDKFCFPLLPESYSEDFKYANFPDQADPLWFRYEREGEFEIYPEPKILFYYTRSHESIYETDKSKREENTIEKITVTYNVETRVVEARPNRSCSDDPTTASDCFVKRQLQAIKEICGCLLFTYRKMDTAHSGGGPVPYCNWTYYETCRHLLQHSRQKNEEECNKKCEHTFYKWKTTVHARPEKNVRSVLFEIVLRPLYAPFTKFTLTLKDSEEKFLSQIGGIVNLYLGVSGLSICTFVILCVDFVRLCYNAHTKNSQASEKPGRSSMCKMKDAWHEWRSQSKMALGAGGAPGNDIRKEVERLSDGMARMEKQMETMCQTMRNLELAFTRSLGRDDKECTQSAESGVWQRL